MLFKSILLGVAILFFQSDNFIPLKGEFESHKIKFNYVSTAYMRDGRYYINNYIRCNSREPICLKWPIAQMTLDNVKPLKTETNKEIYVHYPVPCYVATIFLGRSWNEPIENIKCYKDDYPDKSTADNYNTKVSSVSELGDNMNVEITSSRIAQLNLATIQFEVHGEASLLIEKSNTYEIEFDTTKPSFGIITRNNIGELFSESKNSNEMAETLIPYNSTKSYYHFQKDSSENHMKITLTSKGKNFSPEDLSVCLLSDNHYQNIAFLTKVFAAK